MHTTPVCTSSVVKDQLKAVSCSDLIFSSRYRATVPPALLHLNLSLFSLLTLPGELT